MMNLYPCGCSRPKVEAGACDVYAPDGTRRPGGKEPYAPPVLRRLGSVQELTLVQGTVQATEPLTGISPKTIP